MYRRELLDARKALRSTRRDVSGPRSKKQRGEWESSEIQYCEMFCCSSFSRLKEQKHHTVAANYKMHTQLIGTVVMKIKAK